MDKLKEALNLFKFVILRFLLRVCISSFLSILFNFWFVVAMVCLRCTNNARTYTKLLMNFADLFKYLLIALVTWCFNAQIVFLGFGYVCLQDEERQRKQEFEQMKLNIKIIIHLEQLLSGEAIYTDCPLKLLAFNYFAPELCLLSVKDFCSLLLLSSIAFYFIYLKKEHF